jgi:hypothetical protein
LLEFILFQVVVLEAKATKFDGKYPKKIFELEQKIEVFVLPELDCLG